MATPQATPSRLTINQRKEQRPCFDEPLGDNLTLRMMQIPAGTFMMGSPADEPKRRDNEDPQHQVTVAAFFMGKYPVTQQQWQFVAKLQPVDQELELFPSEHDDYDCPVERVSWYDANEFCKRLSHHTGRNYRLPSEAEWEYACRAGTETPFHFGKTITTDLANYNGSDQEHGFYAFGPTGDYRRRPTSVGYFGVANAFGLCDMHGNVWEWCADDWHDNYRGAPSDGSIWLTKDRKASKVRRGGAWSRSPRNARSAARGKDHPGIRNPSFGFRVVCLAP